LLARGISDHGGSPTKVGEYWAAGLPVVTTGNISDADEIIRRERVGVIVDDHSDAGYVRALDELVSLLQDDGLSLRCRQAAEIHYALEPACDRQAGLYHYLMSKQRSRIH
jgi:glycosyltransferase involved in cell wall biosynthesis